MELRKARLEQDADSVPSGGRQHSKHVNSRVACSADQDRSAKAINRKADTNVQKKSDCAVIPVNQPNKEGQPSAEGGDEPEAVDASLTGS